MFFKFRIRDFVFFNSTVFSEKRRKNLKWLVTYNDYIYFTNILWRLYCDLYLFSTNFLVFIVKKFFFELLFYYVFGLFDIDLIRALLVCYEAMEKGNSSHSRSQSSNNGGTSQSRGGTSRGSGGKAAGNQTVQVQTSSGTCYTSASNVKLVDRLARDMANASAPDLPYYERQHLAEHFARKFWDDWSNILDFQNVSL